MGKLPPNRQVYSFVLKQRAFEFVARCHDLGIKTSDPMPLYEQGWHVIRYW